MNKNNDYMSIKELYMLLLGILLMAVMPILGCSTPIAPGANNIVYEPGTNLSVATTSPVQPNSGDPVRYGYLTGVALTKYDSDNKTTVDFGAYVCSIPVTAAGGDVTAGDALYYRDSITGVTNYSTGTYYFGVAMAHVTSGNTTTINVVHTPSPGAGTLGSGTVSATNLASNSVIEAKIGALAVTNGKIGLLAVDTGQINTAAVTLAKIAPNSIDGTIAKVVATGDAIGGIPNIHMIVVPTGTTGNVDTTITNTELVTDVWFVKDAVGAAGDANTIQLANGATTNYITNAISTNGTSAGAMVRAGVIVNAYNKLAAGAVLRIIRTNAGVGDVGGTVYVSTIRVAP